MAEHGCQGPRVERVPAGSRWDRLLVAAVSIAVIVLVAAAFFLVAGTGTAAVVLTGAAVLVAVLALVVAYGATTAARSAVAATAGETVLARLDATAPAVSLRLCAVVACRENGDVRLEAALEFANHATVPAVVSVGAPSLGHVRERGRQPLPPGATLPVRLTHRVSAAEVEAALSTSPDHRFGWSVTVPATVENLAGTVVDDVRLSFRMVPFLRSPRGTWTWTDAAAEHDGGYARLLRRDYRPAAVSA